MSYTLQLGIPRDIGYEETSSSEEFVSSPYDMNY